jgi:hypothetical protein
VRQGDALSAVLLTLVLDHVINKLDVRGNTWTRMVQISACADDIVIIWRHESNRRNITKIAGCSTRSRISNESKKKNSWE